MSATVETIVSPYFMHGAVDLTAQVKEISLNFALDELEKTASGDTSHVFAPGLEAPKCTITFFMNYGAGSVDATLWAAKATATAMTIRRKTGARAADNPEFTFSAFASSIPLISGGIGTLSEAQITFSLTTAVSRNVTP